MRANVTSSSSHAAGLRMPRHALHLAAALMVLAVVGLPAGEARTLNVTAYGNGAPGWFEIDGYEGRNPVVGLVPGESLKVRFRNQGETGHNIAFGPPVNQALACCLPPGQETTATFGIPDDASGTMPYYCQLHEVQGMRGLIELPGAPDAPPPNPPPASPPPPPGPDQDSPALGPTIGLAALAAAALSRRAGPPPPQP